MSDRLTRDAITRNVTVNVNVWKDGGLSVSVITDDGDMTVETAQNLASVNATLIMGGGVALTHTDTSVVHGTTINYFQQKGSS